MKLISDYVEKERNRFDGIATNTFMFAFMEISRYRDYLDIIFGRYQEVDLLFISKTKVFQELIKGSSDGLLTEEMHNLLNDQGEISAKLHLEIESFYLFAKILLDKAAQSLQFYFGLARNCSLSSHDKLVKFLTAYSEAKGLVLPQKHLAIAQRLKRDISDFRDYQISHIDNYRHGRVVRGTSYSSEGRSRISIGMLYPTAKDRQHESRPPSDLLKEIDEYIESTLSVIENNKNLTKLKLATGESNPIDKA